VIEREVAARLPVRLLQGDIDEARTRNAFKRLITSVLQDQGVLPRSQKPTLHRAKPHLVKSERDED
jgi:hypothetical protein